MVGLEDGKADPVGLGSFGRLVSTLGINDGLTEGAEQSERLQTHR